MGGSFTGSAPTVRSAHHVPSSGLTACPLLGRVVLHGDGEGPLAADEHDEALVARDRRIEEVALEHHIVLRVHRDDDARVGERSDRGETCSEGLCPGIEMSERALKGEDVALCARELHEECLSRTGV
jgi:hypothetical protein